MISALPYLLPGALTVLLSFNAGGFFPQTTAIAIIIVGLALVVRLLVDPRPAASVSGPAVVAVALLAGFGAWAYLSSGWSDAPVRALVEFDRVLLYLVVLVLYASLARTGTAARWLVRGLVAAAVVVCTAALVTRTLPDLWPTSPDVANDRLSYPLTYWNSLGLLATLGMLLAFGLTSDLRERAAVRVAAAGALPLLAATLVFTYSRASMLLAAVGLLALIVLIRGPGVVSGVLVLPAVAVAVAAALDADLLASERPTAPAAVQQGGDVFVVVVFCAIGALVARWTLLRLDARSERSGVTAWRIPRAVPLGAAALVAVVLGAGLAAGGADALSRQYDRFVARDQVEQTQDRRRRLIDPGNNGRIAQWRVAADGFAANPVEGMGAGTYALTWMQDRPSEFRVEDAHSLYLETLAELGVVGGVLLFSFLLAILVALLRRVRGPDRAVWAGLFAAATVWALHAGVDWDWEMPAVTLWVFAAGGLALAAAPDRARGRRVPPVARAVLAGAVVLLLVTPARVVYAEDAARDGREAFAAGDCAAAIERSQVATERLDVASEPHEIIGYCLMSVGRPDAAVASMRAAVRRDPRNWRVHYGLALALGAAGRDPRPAIRQARALNPLDGLIIRTSESLHATSDPRSWRKRALAAELPQD